MTDLFAAFLSDVANDCVSANSGPTDWCAIEAALAEMRSPRAGVNPVRESQRRGAELPTLGGVAGWDPGAA